MMENVYLFEGFDGAGKTTLINKLVSFYGSSNVRIIGRKNEAELKPLSAIIERETGIGSHGEVLMRLALEFERVQLIKDASMQYKVVLVDRSFVSAFSWCDYYKLDRTLFIGCAKKLVDEMTGSTCFICKASFDLCWERTVERNEMSKKEKFGRLYNERFYDAFYANCDNFEAQSDGLKWRHIDTSLSEDFSMHCLLEGLLV